MSYETAQGHPADAMLDAMLAMEAATPAEVTQAFNAENEALMLQFAAEAGHVLMTNLVAIAQELGSNIAQVAPGETVTDQFDFLGWNDLFGIGEEEQ
jgi:hypothetical protein